MRAPTAATRLFAVLGDPVAHSLSPVFQNAALQALSLDGVYVALRCDRDALEGVVRGLAGAGGGGNVTVPHKEAAARLLDVRSEAVRAVGACNTFWGDAEGRVHGDNTDVAGVTGSVRELLGRSAADARVLVVGAGGAARAVVHALASHAAERIVILNRTRHRAEALADHFREHARRIDVAESAEEIAGDAFDLAINATSLGMGAGDPLPLDPDAGPSVDAAFDLVYARGGETPWVREMRNRGVPAMDGTEMLVQQGAAAFRCWWGMEPPLHVMRDALRAGALEETSPTP